MTGQAVTAIVGDLTQMAAAYRQQKIPAGTPKQCFQNAIDLADDRELIYTEGYMLRPGAPMLIHHAWCVTPAGVVVDPTIPDPETCAYYGIEFEVDWVVGLGYLGVALERHAVRLHEEGQRQHIAATKRASLRRRGRS